MQPVNKTERNRAFGNFLLFFIVTIAFILAAVFFSVQVPFKQNEKLQEQVALFDNEKTLAERFSNKLNETMGYFESVNKQDSQPERVNNQITQNLNELGVMINTDSTMFKGLYQNIINSLYDLQAAKKDLRGASSLDANVGDLEKKLNMCMAENTRLQNLILMQQQH